MNYKYILTVLLFSLSISQVSVSDIESMTNNKIDQMIDDLKDQSQKEESLDVKPQEIDAKLGMFTEMEEDWNNKGRLSVNKNG